MHKDKYNMQEKCSRNVLAEIFLAFHLLLRSYLLSVIMSITSIPRLCVPTLFRLVISMMSISISNIENEMNTTGRLQVYLFGHFRLLRDGAEVSSKDWHTRQARQLFKVLLQERGRLVSARKLLDLLWPENVENAHKALRSAVSALRDVLEPDREPWISSSFVPRGQGGYALVFPSTCAEWIDVSEFERLLEAGLRGPNSAETRSLLESALRLYTGDYLAEDGEAGWVLSERSRLRERYFAGVVRLMEWQGEFNLYHQAIELGRRALEHDICRESLYRIIMQYQALAGDNAAALQTFEQGRRALDEHLGADPSPQTLALHMSILNGEFPNRPPSGFAGRVLQNDCEVEARELTRRLMETQEQALRYTMQAADYARRASSYQQALADYDAASRLLEVQGARHGKAREAGTEWWGRLYHGRGMVYEALQDWPGIRENHFHLSAWATTQQDPVLANGSVQRMIVNRALMGYLSDALAMGRAFFEQLQQESERLPGQSAQARESLYLLRDLASRWERILTLDDPTNQGQVPASPFPLFCAASSPGVRDWDRAIEILGPSQSAFTLTMYGWTLLMQGLSKDAELCLQAALRAAEATGQVTWETLASLYLSQTYSLYGQSQRSKWAFAHCMERCQQVHGATWVTIWPLLNRAYHLLQLGHLDEAEQAFCLARQQLEGQDLPAYYYSLQIGLGLLALERRQFERAQKLLHETLAQKQSVYIEAYILAEVGLARLAQERGVYTEACERLRNMLALSGSHSLLYFYATSALSLARLSLRTRQIQGIADLLEQVSQLVTAAGSTGLARECRQLQAELS